MHLPTLSVFGLATHVSASLYPAAGDALSISARSARGYAPDLAISGGVLASKWVEGTKYTQIVDFVVTNNHPANSLTLADTLNFTMKSNNLELVHSATLTRLAPKQTTVVQLGVRNLRATHLLALHAAAQLSRRRQVTFNNRCGIGGDFQTPEYATNTGTVVAKWESNRGMDPCSFGYNYRTPDSEYLNGNDIVQNLVDIVSKNVNFLLDIGPKHDGSIPEIMQKGLRDAGSWIIPHGESIYDTRYWRVTPGKDRSRYTTTKDAFYIHYLTKPGSTITITDPVPRLPGCTVTVLGGSRNGQVVQATKSGNNLVLQLNDAIVNGDNYVWTFKLAYTSNY